MKNLNKDERKLNRKKKTINIFEIIFLGIFLISLTSAITIYSGEFYSFESEQFDYYTIAGNSSDMDGMNISYENGNTTISFSKYFASDSFTLIFFNKEKEIIKEIPSDCPSCGSSGGSNTITKYVDRNITNYLDRPVIEYEEKIVEKPIEKIIKKTPSWIFIIFPVLFVILIFEIISYFKKDINTVERREKK